MAELKKKLVEKLLTILLELGYVSKQGFAEIRIVVENHKIAKIDFLDKERF